MCAYLHDKFEVFSIILTSFRRGLILPSPLPQNEPLKSPPRLGLNTAVFKHKLLIQHINIAQFSNLLVIAQFSSLQHSFLIYSIVFQFINIAWFSNFQKESNHVRSSRLILNFNLNKSLLFFFPFQYKSQQRTGT